MLLLAIVIIMMVLMIGNDIRSRKKEMSMYMVQGYTRKELIRILGMEYAIRFTPIMIYASIAAAVVMLFENWVLRTFTAREVQLLQMNLSVSSIVTGVVIIVIVLITAVHNISQQIREINLLKEIRSEG
ncbi:MAG: FtsX-like permease family protein [Lachnospiraceae bacterium]|nr:FtsX-like permease family protein [Lachnospiraceae bacterium]